MSLEFALLLVITVLLFAILWAAAELTSQDKERKRLEREVNDTWKILGGRENHWIDLLDRDGVLVREQLRLSAAIAFELDARENRPTVGTEMLADAAITSAKINHQG